MVLYASCEALPVTEQEITLKEYFDKRLAALEKALEDWVRLWREERERGLQAIQRRSDELEKRITERASLLERALDKADEQMNKRLEGMNEFRQSMEDQRARLASRELVDTLTGALEKRIRELENWSANVQGRLLVISGVWGLVVMFLSVLANYAIRKAFE